MRHESKAFRPAISSNMSLIIRYPDATACYIPTDPIVHKHNMADIFFGIGTAILCGVL